MMIFFERSEVENLTLLNPAEQGFFTKNHLTGLRKI